MDLLARLTILACLDHAVTIEVRDVHLPARPHHPKRLRQPRSINVRNVIVAVPQPLSETTSLIRQRILRLLLTVRLNVQRRTRSDRLRSNPPALQILVKEILRPTKLISVAFHLRIEQPDQIKDIALPPARRHVTELVDHVASVRHVQGKRRGRVGAPRHLIQDVVGVEVGGSVPRLVHHERQRQVCLRQGNPYGV